MNTSVLSKEINIQRPLVYLHKKEEILACLVVLLFILTPFVEMVYCLFNKVERTLPIVFYPFLILKIVFPLACILGVVLLVSWLVHLKQKYGRLNDLLIQNRMYLFFSLTVIWILIASLVTGTIDIYYSHGFFHNETLPLVISYFVIFLFCSSRVEDPEKKELLVSVSAAVSILLAVYSLSLFTMIRYGIVVDNSFGLSGIFTNTNFYGYYLCIHLMLGSGLFSLGRTAFRQYLGLTACVVNTIVLVINNTLGAWLACFFAFVFQIIVIYLVHHRFDRRTSVLLGTFIGLTIIVGCFFQTITSSIVQLFVDVKDVTLQSENVDNAGSGRWILWRITVGLISERPLFGYGNEGIDHVLEAATTNCSRPHNELLQYAAFYGIPAAVLYFAGVMSVFINGYRKRDVLDNGTLICLIGAFSYFVSSMFGNTMYFTAPFFFIFLGMGWKRTTQNNDLK